MEKRVGLTFDLKYLFLPRTNHWLKRILLVTSFILFDYLVTLICCQAPYQEANLYARGFMHLLGIPLGLTTFVLVANLPIYITLSLDSHIVKFPRYIAVFTEVLVDVLFAWFVAGLHFSGGTSWFWSAPQLTRQSLGAILYLIIAFPTVKPHNPKYNH